MAQASLFWDRHAKGYAKRPVSDQATYEKKLKITQDYLRPDMEVLELGCGTGTTALIHAPFVKHIRAVDISEKMLEIARGKAESRDIENVTFERSSIEDLAAADATYDVVMTHSVLHLLKDKDAAVAKIHRLLKPGGVFVSSTACLGEMMSLWRLVLPIGHFLGLLPLVRFLTVDELVRDLTDAGFRIDHEWRPGKGKTLFAVAIKE
ncbi:MAG: methyltransferase domain-containing protein [Alphaproteobacteria bacterium]|nr:methyltransferase domain-containing protein [Alphaproteobacteria bacterium]